MSKFNTKLFIKKSWMHRSTEIYLQTDATIITENYIGNKQNKKEIYYL